MNASPRGTARARTAKTGAANARKHAKHLTIRNVPDEVARALAAETRRRGASLNQAVIDLLRQALGVGAGAAYDNGLGRLAGTWSDDDLAAFEDATSGFETIDEDLWR